MKISHDIYLFNSMHIYLNNNAKVVFTYFGKLIHLFHIQINLNQLNYLRKFIEVFLVFVRRM